ncbi:MAG: hypothetical protein U0800_24185 [Isosphaeraceae bacterium]
MRTPRRFLIVDMMGLVAAVALGLALDRWRATELGPLPPGVQGSSIGASHWLHVLGNGGPSCYVAALALALIPLRWRPPRPSAARLLRQPGAVACLAIVGTMLANLAILAVSRGIRARLDGPESPATIYSHWYYWGQAVEWISMGVLGAWAALALGGRWSPEKSWIDRLGIALGAYWVAIYFLGFFWAIIDRWLPYR